MESPSAESRAHEAPRSLSWQRTLAASAESGGRVSPDAADPWCAGLAEGLAELSDAQQRSKTAAGHALAAISAAGGLAAHSPSATGAQSPGVRTSADETVL